MASGLEFYPYQRYCIDRVVHEPCIGLFLDMGLGKTAIMLEAIRRLRYDRWAVGRVLVIAPKAVAMAVWHNEAAKWPELCDLCIKHVLGSERQRLAALDEDADIYITNRENTAWLVEHYKNAWPFDMVVLDESSSFKNYRAVRFKALKRVRSHIDRMVLLTGTPDPHGLMDLWAQIWLLDGGQRLGRTVTAFRDAFFTPGKRSQSVIFTYDPKPGAFEKITGLISDICVSMKTEDYLELPPLIYDDIPVKLDDRAQKVYDRMERDMLLQVDGETITAGSAGILANKLLQLCNGACYDELKNVVPVHDCKINALLETIEQLNGQHAIICYSYRHDLDRISSALESAGWHGVVYQGPEDADAWNSGDIDLLLIQPASCGYGLNLQGGGHHIIWFGLTWNLELYQQTNKRLHRQGQTVPVIVHHLLVEGGEDEDVKKSLNGKADAQDALISALKARIGRAQGGTR